MQDASLNTLLAIPWAKALIEDPKWTCAVTPSRVPKPSGEDELYAVTLATDRTFRAYQTLRPTTELDGKLVYHEIKGIVTLGDGLAGFAGVCHGGIAATLLDETCGILVGSSQERHLERWKQSGASAQPPKLNFMTVYLNMTYKRPIPAPSTILCTAKVTRHDGRKIFMRATIEDGEGVVYTTADGMFIEVKPKL